MPKGAEAFGAWWDELAAQKATAFFERHLRHTEGEWAGKPFRLAAWQRDSIIRPMFGWKRADGTRLIRVAWIEVPRKNGKTELAAGISALALVGDGEVGGQAYSLAVDKSQASIVFRKTQAMVAMSPELRKIMEVLKDSIYCPRLNSTFRPLSAGPQGKHGLSATFAVGDEVHEWPNGDLADVVHKSTAARRQPLEVYITTAGISGVGYAWEMHELALQVQSGEVTDPTMLVVIFAAPQDADWTKEETWRAANPNYGVSPKPEYMASEAQKAARSPRLENEFRRYHLNQWTEQAIRWLPMGEAGWKGCTAEPGNSRLWSSLPAKLQRRRCFGAIDIGITSDLSSLALLFPPEGEETRYTLLWKFWLPEAAVESQGMARRARYISFRDAGALTLTSGNITDFAVLERDIVEASDQFDIAWIGIDPYNAADMMVRLQDSHGLPIQQFRQGMLSMSSPSKSFERLVTGSLMEHGSHPVATWMARNAVVETDANGNIKPAKGKAADKIDGIVAAVMALGGAQANSEPKKEASVYETRGLLIL